MGSGISPTVASISKAGEALMSPPPAAYVLIVFPALLGSLFASMGIGHYFGNRYRELSLNILCVTFTIVLTAFIERGLWSSDVPYAEQGYQIGQWGSWVLQIVVLIGAVLMHWIRLDEK
jgi:hypothetical protein